MLQRNAVPDQRSTGGMICARSFNDVATRPGHWQSLCRTGIVCQRFRWDQVLRRDRCRSTAFSASSRNVDLDGEAKTLRKKQSNPIVLPA